MLSPKRLLALQSVRRFCSAIDHPKVCIVGSGPASFYTAQQILKRDQNALVDIFEKLPVPFGLVRYGVAPDHPDVKNVINTFTQTASNPRCRFHGNVEIGKDLTLKQLGEAYHAVVLSYGADEDRKLGIDGEDLGNVLSARTFVGWYNGLPEDRNLNPDLTATDVAAVIGHGNVAIDVARILLTPIDVLRKTDITESALETLSKSRIRRVHLIGRRGPVQVSFTIKELRELVKMPNTSTVIDPKYFENVDEFLRTAQRPRKRLTELLLKTANTTPPSGRDNELRVDFLRSPVSFEGLNGRVSGIKLVVNELEGPIGEKQNVVATPSVETLTTGLVLTSIGYKSRPIVDRSLPFDLTKGVVLNTNGRVANMPGFYCSGWVKTGPVGVILSTMTDGFDVGKIVVKDLNEGLANDKKEGFESLRPILAERNLRVVEWKDWEVIDRFEVANARNGSPRRKITTVEEMLKLLD